MLNVSFGAILYSKETKNMIWIHTDESRLLWLVLVNMEIKYWVTNKAGDFMDQITNKVLETHLASQTR
jgi:hypothetical protein